MYRALSDAFLVDHAAPQAGIRMLPAKSADEGIVVVWSAADVSAVLGASTRCCSTAAAAAAAAALLLGRPRLADAEGLERGRNLNDGEASRLDQLATRLSSLLQA